MDKNNSYDVIIIGSGIGGLTLGSILSKMNKKKVSILEKHFTAGGQTHEFKRKSYTWDTGLHYVGELEKGELARKFFDYITDNKLNWKSLPEYFENYHYPDINFKVSKNFKIFKKDLLDKFPLEEKAINRYFKDITKAVLWNQRYYFIKIFPFYISWILKIINSIHKKYYKLTVTQYFKKYFKDEKLISILSSQWISYMMPPNEASFICHAVIVTHYLKGGFYPEGGSKNIAEHIIPVIEKNNGKVLLNRNVKSIITKNNKAVGVAAELNNKNTSGNIEKFYAPVIISNTGILNTYSKFLDKIADEEVIDDISAFHPGYSSLSLYLGFKKNPSELGFTGANEWIFDDYNHDKIFKDAHKIIEGKPNHCVVSFQSMKTGLDNKNYSGQIIYYLDYSFFKKWKDKAWLKRDKEYYKLKDEIAEKLISKVNEKYPGFTDLVEFYELSTPLTMEHFTNREKGVYNGMPLIPEKYTKKWVDIKTPLKNFYITGTDLNFFGIIGGMMGGIATASFLNGGFGFVKLMANIFKPEKKIG